MVDAMAQYDDAIWLYPEDATSYHSRGIACANQSQCQRAIRDFDKAIRLTLSGSKDWQKLLGRGYLVRWTKWINGVRFRIAKS